MSHEIEDNKAFFKGQPAWHGLGKVLSDAPSVKEAWEIAYPHTLHECPIEAYILDDNSVKNYLPLTTHKAIIRDDGKHLGIVGIDYKLEQPFEVMNFFQPYIESGLVELEAGGSLREGSRIWALGKIKQSEKEIVKGDTVKAYLLAATAFDGSLARLTKFCDTRVVCANTLAIARGERTTEWKVRHTKNMDEKMEAVQEHVSAALNAHNKSVEAYRYLASKKMERKAQVSYIVEVIAGKKEKKDWSAQLTTKVTTVIDLIDRQRGLEYVPAIKGTAWQAYNAVSEYVTHHAARNSDNRLNNQWFDASTQDLNQRALEVALAA